MQSGVGGRDLSRDVGGITTLMAIDLLDDDPQTRHIVLDIETTAATRHCAGLRACRALPKACHRLFHRRRQPGKCRATPSRWRRWKALRCTSWTKTSCPAMTHAHRHQVFRLAGMASRGCLPVARCARKPSSSSRRPASGFGSNVPIPGVYDDNDSSIAHRLVDLGADDFTQGKPHPMIDPLVRVPVLQSAMTDAQTGVVLLDVVIGYGAHEDPAGVLVAALGDQPAAGSPLVIASVTGTDADPQDRSRTSLETAACRRARGKFQRTSRAMGAGCCGGPDMMLRSCCPPRQHNCFSIACFAAVAPAWQTISRAAPINGRIAAVYETTFYVEFAGQVVCVVGADRANAPLNVVCDIPATVCWPSHGLASGVTVRTAHNCMTVGQRFRFHLGRRSRLGRRQSRRRHGP